MKKIKPIILLFPFILTSCGPSATALTKEEAFSKLDAIRKYYESGSVATPDQLVTRKEQKSWSDNFQTYGTYNAYFAFDNSRPGNILGYSKEIFTNIDKYSHATIERWYLINENETKAGVISKSEVESEIFQHQFDLNDFGQKNEFTMLINATVLSALHYSYTVSNVFADDLTINSLGNEYVFSTNGNDLIMDVSNTKETLVETSHIVFDGNLITKDSYNKKLGDALIKEYTTTYSLEKGNIPSCPKNNLI